MATIKVKRNSNSRGKCKLAFNKVYTARVNPTYNRSYIIGNNVYLSEYFTIVTDQQPKLKPIVKPDPKTGKFVVQKPERDWSVPQAFPMGYIVRKGDVIFTQGVGTAHVGTRGTVVTWYGHICTVDTGQKRIPVSSHLLAPLNPTDHPEHPDFGKAKPHPYSEYDHSVEFTLKPFDPESELTPEHPDFGKVKPAANWEKDFPFEFEFIESKPQPQPFDMREIIAGYIRQHGTQLTAIELIGHLTIDAKWQSTEK